MMRKIAMLAVVLLVGTANAQQGPRPAAELERLKPLDGNWTCKGVTPAGAMGAGSPEFKYNSTFTIKPSSNGVAYTIVYDQKEATPPYSGSWSVAWDGAKKKLVFFYLDTVGNVGLQTVGDWHGDALVVQGEGYAVPAPSGFVPPALAGKAIFRDTFTRKGDSNMHWKGELKLRGMKTWTVIGDDDCTKL
ncbi:hypothetical protein [Ralstonia pseudosolanacearum]|uniref:hypothetical protein n=1 Tax=Ralstonia pseudosolanacearum TaxID=1310165 RepID=UPI003D06C9AD